MKTFSRREFFKWMSLGPAAAFAGLAAPRRASGKVTGSAGKTGKGTGSMEEPPGALFKDPSDAKNLNDTAGNVEVNLTAKPFPVQVNGTPANILTYNDSFPGPTIRAKRGDLLNIHFRNSIPAMGKNVLGYDQEVTNLHARGLHVSPQGNSDNAVLMFLSGNVFDYQFDLAAQEPGTLHFYHPFSQGTAAEQSWGGLAGALVIEDATDILKGYETHILVLKDISLTGGAPEPYASPADYLRGKEGALVMVNGQVNPVLTIRPGQVQRWRLLNASNARFYHLRLENHFLHVIGTDGGQLDKPYPVSSVLMAPGERLDVLVKADPALKRHRFLSEPYDRGAGVVDRRRSLLTLACEGAAAGDALPAAINANASRTTAKPVKTERIVLSLDRGRGYINGFSFGQEEAFTIESTMGTHEMWEIVNKSAMDQVFHVQTNPFQVISLNGGDQAYASLYTRTPAWKDTIIVPRQGSAHILLPVMDFTGTAFLNCQMEHMDIGMMGVWDITEQEEGEDGDSERQQA